MNNKDSLQLLVVFWGVVLFIWGIGLIWVAVHNFKKEKK